MTLLSKQTVKSQSDYRTRLNASIECAYFLLHQGLPFRCHDECECSSNQKNYLELLHFLSRNNEAIKRVTFNETPRHNKLTSPDIQKDITQAAIEEITNERFKMMRENDWESLLEKVSSFCIKHDIDILIMDDEYKLLDLMVLGDQLDTYIIDLCGDDEFSGIEVIKLLLLLPVATATVERVFSAMHIVKSRLRNRMGDKWMNDSLVVYIKKDIFDKIDNEAIMKQFQNMKTRIKQL
ncbi:hypothetical protein NC653_008536 [Populus alba x Populus x berolinensis]|uniref:DUF4371 domain-containing protein n=1 Tax=Populus alba x Populus x berolinensis TaxID=444605 RepID=A0AAD6R6V4_9ROSI|nr:hypothetical protein NC653_008536 [Populus alba x Populus x berolinensis]